jgi:hypothetical protein
MRHGVLGIGFAQFDSSIVWTNFGQLTAIFQCFQVCKRETYWWSEWLLKKLFIDFLHFEDLLDTAANIETDHKFCEIATIN